MADSPERDPYERPDPSNCISCCSWGKLPCVCIWDDVVDGKFTAPATPPIIRVVGQGLWLRAF